MSRTPGASSSGFERALLEFSSRLGQLHLIRLSDQLSRRDLCSIVLNRNQKLLRFALNDSPKEPSQTRTSTPSRRQAPMPSLASPIQSSRAVFFIRLNEFCAPELSPSFSDSCKLLLPHLLCFDNHLNCPGGGGTADVSRTACPIHLSSFQSLGHSLPKGRGTLLAAALQRSPLRKAAPTTGAKEKDEFSWRRRSWRWRGRQKQTRR